jgi:hypothetical protein
MRQGFTRIGLLVVAALVVGAAAMILYPVFDRGCWCGDQRQNDCLSNVKQIHLGLVMYASDHDQMYPPDRRGTGTSAVYWPSAILPYVKNVQIFLCPSDTIVTGSIELPATGPVANLSYGRNSYVGTPGLSDAKITYPAEMLGVMDAVAYSISHNGTLAGVRAQITTDGTADTARAATSRTWTGT